MIKYFAYLLNRYYDSHHVKLYSDGIRVDPKARCENMCTGNRETGREMLFGAQLTWTQDLLQ